MAEYDVYTTGLEPETAEPGIDSVGTTDVEVQLSPEAGDGGGSSGSSPSVRSVPPLVRSVP